MTKETLDELIKRLNSEPTKLEAYRDDYPELFSREKEKLSDLLPKDLIGRIEHFGSTAIPGICAKPIIDILVEVISLERTKVEIVPLLEDLGYDYLLRPTIGMEPPWYAWFIKRDNNGKRTHHIHMIEQDFVMWERLLFRDYLRQFPDEAKRYSDLKEELSGKYPNNREAYTMGKSSLIGELMRAAKKKYLTNNVRNC